MRPFVVAVVQPSIQVGLQRLHALEQLDTSIYGSDVVTVAVAEVTPKPAGFRLPG